MSASAEPAIDLHRVSKLYGRTAALRAVSLRVAPGETLALLGPNGSGKTTLLKLLAGAISPTTGHGTIFGRDIVAERAELRAVIGFVAADTYLYDDLTASENLRFALTMAGRRSSEGDVAGALQRVDLAEQAEARVGSFSSGMQRRLALARLLLLWPRLLLLDEPYTNLDARGADLVDEVVREAQESGRTVVLATHDTDRALALAGRTALLEGGRIVSLDAAPAGSGAHSPGRHPLPA